MFKPILVFLAALMFTGTAFADPPGHRKLDRREAYFERNPHERTWTYNHERKFHPRWGRTHPRHHHHTVRIYRYQGRDVLFGVIIGAAVVAILTQAQYEREFGRSPY